MKRKTEDTLMLLAIVVSVLGFIGLMVYAFLSPKLTLDKDSWVCTAHQYNLVTKSTVCTQYNRK